VTVFRRGGTSTRRLPSSGRVLLSTRN